MKVKISLMYCKSGTGLMSYGYNFLQIGGYAGQSYDDVKKEEPWDGNINAGETVLDCRNGKCVKISREEFKKFIKDET